MFLRQDHDLPRPAALEKWDSLAWEPEYLQAAHLSGRAGVWLCAVRVGLGKRSCPELCSPEKMLQVRYAAWNTASPPADTQRDSSVASCVCMRVCARRTCVCTLLLKEEAGSEGRLSGESTVERAPCREFSEAPSSFP